MRAGHVSELHRDRPHTLLALSLSLESNTGRSGPVGLGQAVSQLAPLQGHAIIGWLYVGFSSVPRECVAQTQALVPRRGRGRRREPIVFAGWCYTVHWQEAGGQVQEVMWWRGRSTENTNTQTHTDTRQTSIKETGYVNQRNWHKHARVTSRMNAERFTQTGHKNTLLQHLSLIEEH